MSLHNVPLWLYDHKEKLNDLEGIRCFSQAAYIKWEGR